MEEASKQKELEKLRLDEAALSQQEHFLQENLIRLFGEMEAFTKESRELEESLKSSREETDKKEQGIQNLKEAVEQCAVLEEELLKKREEKQAAKEEKTTSHKAFFEKRDQLSERTSLLDKECFRLKSQAEKVEEQREAQISYMWEEYEITPNNALSYRKEELTDRQEMKKDVSRIKDEIRRLGSVNVNAIEDYKNLLERHTFLSGQYELILLRRKKLWKGSFRNLTKECENSLQKSSMIYKESLIRLLKSFLEAEKVLLSFRRRKIFWKLELRSFPSLLEKNFRI